MLDLVLIGIAAALIAAIPSCVTISLARKLNEIQERRDLYEQRVAQASYKLALFRMRVEVFGGVRSHIAESVTEGRPAIGAAVHLRRHGRTPASCSRRRFLFPPALREFVAELSRQASGYQRAYLLREPLKLKTASGAPPPRTSARCPTRSLRDARHRGPAHGDLAERPLPAGIPALPDAARIAVRARGAQG